MELTYGDAVLILFVVTAVIMILWGKMYRKIQKLKNQNKNLTKALNESQQIIYKSNLTKTLPKDLED